MSVAATPRTLLDVVRLSTAHLAHRGTRSPRLDAELLCAHALGLRRLDLYLQYERRLEEPELSAVRTVLRRRAAGEPVAYITGTREFFGRAFRVTPDVLIPRPETETLVEIALRVLRQHEDPASLRVAEPGTGSGCVAVSIAAEVPELRVVATDRSAPALAVARANAAAHGVTDRIHFVRTDWVGSLGAELDVVVSNPPYVTCDELRAAAPDVRDFEPGPALLGGGDGLDAYRGLLAALCTRLARAAHVILEVDPRRAKAVAELLHDALPGARCSEHADLGGRTRVIACGGQPRT
jgi:release factor glutamine methyltransferase